MKAPTIARVLTGVLVSQLALGAFLVISDLAGAGFRVPQFGPQMPRLSDPVRPGD